MVLLCVVTKEVKIKFRIHRTVEATPDLRYIDYMNMVARHTRTSDCFKKCVIYVLCESQAVKIPTVVGFCNDVRILFNVQNAVFNMKCSLNAYEL